MTHLPRPTLIQRALAMTMAAAATFVTVAGSAAPVAAAPAAKSRSAAVIVSGSDLASPAGEARIAKALTRAARRVCDAGGDRSLAGQRARRTCIATTLGMAMPQLAARADAARSARAALAARNARTALAAARQPIVPVRR